MGLAFLISNAEITNPSARVQVGDTVIDLEISKEVRLSEDAYDCDSLVVGTSAPEFWRQERNNRIEGKLIVEFDVWTGNPSTIHLTRSVPFSARVAPAGTPTVATVSSPPLDAAM